MFPKLHKVEKTVTFTFVKLEDIKVGDRISGIEAGEIVLVKSHDIIGDGCAEITYQTPSGASSYASSSAMTNPS